ncbi:MAG: ABC transporter substrate-binding protein [Acidobacteriia bacterium]|nr:ABC transporter substrate-binding protein [Terriglobia bacterium]
MADDKIRGTEGASPVNLPHRYLRLILIFAIALSGCQRNQPPKEPVTIVFSCLNDWQRPSKVGPDVIAEFTRQTGIVVKTLPYGEELAQRRAQHLSWLERHASTPDVYESDIIELPAIAEHMIDLAPFIGEDAKNYMPTILKNLIVGGKLVAVPNNTDVGLLFYRKDLLRKYGYSGPPRTWDELGRMAARIQAGERAAGGKDFWGFVWEGAPWEGLTYTALEWQASSGGGHIIEPDGTISVNNPYTIAALRRAKGWIGSISPPGVTAYRMEDVLNLSQSVRAAFIRDWPFAYLAGNRPDSLIRDKVDVTYLPSGGAGHLGTLGGWQFSVSKYSAHPQEAIEFVRYLTSYTAQLRFTRELGWTPVRPVLYDDQEGLRINPYFRWLKDTLPRIIVARPSAVTGKSYAAVSDAYAQAVHSVLTGKKTPAEAMADLERTLARLTGLRVRTPPVETPIRAGASLP